MLKTLIYKEIRETINSSKFVITISLCTLLIILSIFTSISNYNAEYNEYKSALILNRNSLNNQSSYLGLAGNGLNINKPPEKLSVFVYGLSGSMGRVANVNVVRDPELKDSKFNNDPLLAMFGIFDLFFIVNIILSLVLILFTYDLIVGENEKGTLKLMFSNSVPKDKIILGKAIGSFMAFVIPLLIPFLLCNIIIVVHPDIQLNSQEWIRVFLIFISFVLYLSVILFVSIFVSVVTKKSSTCLLSLLFIWVLFVAILPKLSVVIASEVKETPSIHAINAQKEAYLNEIQAEAKMRSQRWLQENERLRWINIDEFTRKYKEFLEKQQQELTTEIQNYNYEIDNKYYKIVKEQRKIAVNLSRISPSSTLRYCTMRLAQTDMDEQERFIGTIRIYKSSFTKWVNTKLVENIDNPNIQQLDLSTMPRYSYNTSSFKSSFPKILFDLTILFFIAIVFFIGSYVAFIRYEI